MDIIISHAITALLGALIAAAVTYLVLARTKSGRSSASARAELKQYRERVADHFARTAGLVDQLTDSYKDVFDQLQAGATELLDPDTLREKLAHQDDEVITLKRLGYAVPQAEDTDVPKRDEPGDRDEGTSARHPTDAVSEEDEKTSEGQPANGAAEEQAGERQPADRVPEEDKEAGDRQPADALPEEAAKPEAGAAPDKRG